MDTVRSVLDEQVTWKGNGIEMYKAVDEALRPSCKILPFYAELFIERSAQEWCPAAGVLIRRMKLAAHYNRGLAWKDCLRSYIRWMRYLTWKLQSEQKQNNNNND